MPSMPGDPQAPQASGIDALELRAARDRVLGDKLGVAMHDAALSFGMSEGELIFTRKTETARDALGATRRRH
jgi:hypothetical protein